jgi:hypothetical protein
MKRKKFIEEKNSDFIIVNEFCQVFSGLKSGYPFFQDDWKLAKPLQRMSQFDKIKRGTLDKLEILYL